MNCPSSIITFSTLFNFVLAAATPSDISIRTAGAIFPERRQFGSIPADSCATELLCCNSVSTAGAPATAQLLALLGINIAPSYVVGLTCTPIIGVGVGAGSECSAEPVCCWWGAQYAYLVAIDCTPVDLGL